MQQDRVEEYLGSIYRLRKDPETPLPLSRLAAYFGFSVVSVHEMIQKLHSKGWVEYHPYRGVTLTASGEVAATHLLQRHRLWERFLTDKLGMTWDEAHAVAGHLEHVATDEVMERLAAFLGEPQSRSQLAPVVPVKQSGSELSLSHVPESALARVVRIAPETLSTLRRFEDCGIVPGKCIKVRRQTEEGVEVLVQEEERIVWITPADAGSLWVDVV